MSAGELLDCYLSKKDQVAFRELYYRYQNKLIGFFKALLPNSKHSQINDLIQQTFLNLIQSNTFQHNEIRKFSDYLLITARNTFYQNSKKTKKKNSLIRSLNEKDVEQPSIETGTSKIDNQSDFLEYAIKTLPSENQRIAIELRLEGKSYKEIAEKMMVKETFVKDYLYRAKMNLKKIANQQ